MCHSVPGAPASLGDPGEPREQADARPGVACLVEEGHGSSVPLNEEPAGRARRGQGVEQDSPGQQPQLGCPREPYWRSPASCSLHRKPQSHGPAAQANSGFAQSALSAGPAAPLPPGVPRREVKRIQDGGCPPQPILEAQPSHPLLQQGPPQGYSLLQLPQLPFMLTLRADLDLALVSIEQLQLLLQLLPKGLELCFLGFIKPQLEIRKNKF